MASSHRGIALLIANSSYDHLDDIKNALNDESAMSRRLESCNYEIISAINLNVDDIRTKISHLKRRLAVSQHREVLIYYAGHGLVHNNEHYIAGGRFNEKAQLLDNEVDLNCLSLDSDIINSVCKIVLPEDKTRSLVVILDACRKFTNPLERGLTSGGKLFVPLKPRYETRIGVLVCYACALGLGARDSGEHGLYTDCILQNIFEPGKNIVDAISIANRMAIKRANADQQPVMQVNYTDFFQYPLIQGVPAPDEPQRTRDHDIELLQTEREQLKLDKEKLEQEFQRVQKEFKKLLLENNKIELAKITLADSKAKANDMDVMEKLYESTQGAFWTKNKDRLSWQPNFCSKEFKETSARITYIDLQYNNLIGMIPQELGRLSYLAHLDLSSNKLEGEMPKELGELSNLEHLYLYSNQLTGAIPVELGKLVELKWLNLSGNQFTGAIPVELGKLSELKELYLHSNQLTGAIPAELGELSELKWFYLYSNRLTGAIPVELGKLSQLKELYLHSNQLTGTIPVDLGNLSELMELYLYSNQLKGAIPVEFGKLSKLEKLSLHGNQLTGTIPVELGRLSKLKELSLHSNQLTGEIPKELGELSNLEALWLHGNQLTGEIPKELGELSKLKELWLHGNQLTGAIPVELGKLLNLVDLRLHSNQLTEATPVKLGQLKNLAYLYLHGNQLKGDPPIIMGCSVIFHPQRHPARLWPISRQRSSWQTMQTLFKALSS